MMPGQVLALPQETALQALRQTCLLGKQHHGESVSVAFHRLVGRPMPESLLSSACWFEGRFISVNLYRGGYAAVHDPLQGWEIRHLRPEARTDTVVNMAGAVARRPMWSLFRPQARRPSGAAMTYWHDQDTMLTSIGEWQRT